MYSQGQTPTHLRNRVLTAHDGKANELRGEAARATREAAAALCLAVRVAAACCGSSALTRIDSAVDTDTILRANDAIHLRNRLLRLSIPTFG